MQKPKFMRYALAALAALVFLGGGVPSYAAGPASGIVDKLFVQKGNGAVPRTFADKAQEFISVKDFGAIGNGVADDTSAIQRAQAYAIASTPYKAIKFPAGVYLTSATITFDYPTLSVFGDGRNATTIKYTGTGTAVQFTDAHPNNGTYSFGGKIRDIGIQGSANSGVLLLVKNVHHFVAENVNLKESSTVTGVCLNVVGTVAGHFKDIVCSTNAQLMASRPKTGVIMDADTTSGNRASANKFDNVIIEGMTGDGIQLIGTDQNVFVGGTSENNGGNGVTIVAGSRLNTFISVGFENPLGFADIYDNGFSNRFMNCYTNNQVYFDTASQFSELVGGYHQSISLHGDFATVRDLKYSFFGAGGTVLTTPNTSTRNLFNVQAGGLTYATKAPITVTATGSPFTYQNTSGLDEEVIVSGGTVSQIVFDRNGAVAQLPVTGGMFRVGPNDKLIFSYTVAPAIVRLPFGTNFL